MGTDGKALVGTNSPALKITYGGDVGAPAPPPPTPPAGLDEGLASLSLSNLLYIENPYIYNKCQ